MIHFCFPGWAVFAYRLLTHRSLQHHLYLRNSELVHSVRLLASTVHPLETCSSKVAISDVLAVPDLLFPSQIKKPLMLIKALPQCHMVNCRWSRCKFPPLPSFLSRLYLISAAENATELPNQHKNILLFLAAPFRLPPSRQGLFEAHWRLSSSKYGVCHDKLLYGNKECILMLTLCALFCPRSFQRWSSGAVFQQTLGWHGSSCSISPVLWGVIRKSFC